MKEYSTQYKLLLPTNKPTNEILENDRTELEETIGKGDKLCYYRSLIDSCIILTRFFQTLIASFSKLAGGTSEHPHLFNLFTAQKALRKACNTRHLPRLKIVMLLKKFPYQKFKQTSKELQKLVLSTDCHWQFKQKKN